MSLSSSLRKEFELITHRLALPSTSSLREAHLPGLINSPPSCSPFVTWVIWSRRPSAVDATRTRSSAKARHLTIRLPCTSNPIDLLSPAITSSITQLNRIADNGSPCLTPRPQTMGLLLLPFTLRTVDVLSYMWPTYSTNASGIVIVTPAVYPFTALRAAQLLPPLSVVLGLGPVSELSENAPFCHSPIYPVN